MKILASLAVMIFFVIANDAIAGIIHSEDFNSDNGGYTVTNQGNPEGPWTWDGAGSWYTNGSENLGSPSHSRLTGPSFVVTANGLVELSFAHRYSFEPLWEGGAVFTSVNGGAFTQILAAAFSQNGYTGFGFIGNHDLNGKDGFNGDSAGYANGDFITTIASLGSFNTGDTITLQFLAPWDEFAKGSEPNWQIDWVEVRDASNVPEPATLALMGLGLAGIGCKRYRHKRAA
ncbi:MAG: PEP-CTERM sorting domain-containing protein [Gammaproteobacteria bacterium]|nr:PEP-CTERM sorting domain-containing protein [Gammaproteobacteria bacterium]